MSIQLGDTAPDFFAETTQGKIRFYAWMGSSWAVLFSHPKDFTPVCTTELGEVARLRSEFDMRNVKVIGLSVDPLDAHERWAGDIKETQGYELNFPLIADPDRVISTLYGMIHPNAVIPVRLNKMAVEESVVTSVLAFMAFYGIIAVVSMVVMSILGNDLNTSIGAVAATLGNIGPGIGKVGPALNFSEMHVAGKWFLSFLMLVGRLELFTVLVLFSPMFWRR